MELIAIEDIIKNNTDKSKFNSGFVSYKNKLVKNDYANIENDTITFYGSVLGNSYGEIYTNLIMINTKSRVILTSNCDCENCVSNNSGNKKMICNHIVATVLTGIDKLKNPSVTENKSNEKIKTEVNFGINSYENGYINLDLDISGVSKKEYKKIFNSYKENKKLHRLSDGNYLDLNDNNLRESFNLIDILGIYNDFENMKVHSSKALYISEVINEKNLDFISGINYIQKIKNSFGKDDKYSYEVPESLNATLRDYQIRGLNWFVNLSNHEFGGILADEMGLGKTIQTISFLLSKKGKKSIVITPTSLIYNWKSEFDKFAPTLKVGLVHGNKKQRDSVFEKIDNYDVILTTYGTIKNDIEKYENKIFDYCIIDEAQNIKNPDAITTKTVKSIKANTKFALTGTPIENNLLELWSIFDFVMPGYLYNKVKFQNIFIRDTNNTKKLKTLIKPFILRRTKKEVIKELPDKIETKFFVELNDEHKKVYKAYMKIIKEKIKHTNLSKEKITIFSYLTKLRQLCLSPEILVKNYKGTNSKLDTTLEIVKEAIAENRKILIFSQFTTVLKLIGSEFDKNGISYSYLDGKTNPSDRLKLVDEFNKSEDNKVFLISLKAGGTGLNLTSASMVIHFDPWFNPAVENQASDRAHRIGQKNVVDVIKFVAKDTIEEKIINLQDVKKELIENIIDKDLSSSNSLSVLSNEEIISLFE